MIRTILRTIPLVAALCSPGMTANAATIHRDHSPADGGQVGSGTTILGRLTRTNGHQGMANMTVTISVDGTVVGTVTTGVDGTFTCAYSIPPGATVGAHNITAAFGGTALNSLSTGSATLTVVP